MERVCVDILLIDDDASVRTMLIEALQRRGYSLRAAANGKSALRLFAENQFRLVITDLFMPDVDGIDVINKLSTSSPNTPILAISGGGRRAGSDIMLRTAKCLGSRKTMAKPFEILEFLSAVEHLVSGG